MAKVTVDQLLVDRLNSIEAKLDRLIPIVEGLKVKAAIAGGIAGLVGTGLVSLLISSYK